METLEKTQKALMDRIISLGETRYVAGKKVRELLHLPLEIPGRHEVKNLHSSQSRYVSDKIHEYIHQIERCCKILSLHKPSRQAVIQFDVMGEKPNCMVSISLQVRKGKVYANVLMRSWDIKEKFFQDYCIVLTIMDMVADDLDCKVGGAVFLIANAHYYL